jgi:hypothetical protein
MNMYKPVDKLCAGRKQKHGLKLSTIDTQLFGS